MFYSSLVGSFLNSTIATRPDLSATRQKSVHVEIEQTRYDPKKAERVADQTRI